MYIKILVIVLLCDTIRCAAVSSENKADNDEVKAQISDITDDPSSSLPDLESISSFLDSLNWEQIAEGDEFQEILNIVKKKGKDVVLPSSSHNDSREILLAFLRLDLVSMIGEVLASKPSSVWFPQPDGVSDLCYGDLMTYFEALVERNTTTSTSGDDKRRYEDDWALRMMDSTGKPGAGLMVGRLQFVGNYEECMDAKYNFRGGTNSHAHNFNGLYCRARLPMGERIERRLPDDVNTFWLEEEHLPININWGICVPNSCNEKDLLSFLTKGTIGAYSLPVADVVCFEEKSLAEDAGAIFFISLISLFATVVTVCTFLDIYRVQKDKDGAVADFLRWAFRKERKDERNLNGETISTKEDKIANGVNEGGLDDDKSREKISQEGNGSLLVGGDIDGKGKTSGDEISAEVNYESTNGVTLKDRDTSPTDKKKEDKEEREGHEYHGICNEGFEMCDLGGSDKPTESQSNDSATTGTLEDRDTEEGQPECITANMERRDPESVNADNKLTNGGLKASKTKELEVNQDRESIFDHLVKGASLYNNFTVLLNTNLDTSRPSIKCLEGLKAITMAWIVLGHTYTYGGIIDDGNVLYDNSLEMTNIPDRLEFHIVGSAQFGVDTFFVISGCLVMYISLDKLKAVRKHIMFWPYFVLHRFWRLTPIYMVTLALGTTLYDHIVEGPLRADTLEEFHQCKDKWWSHLLYFNNFYAPEKKCMTWTWFLAVDMQFHVLSTFFIYFTFRNRRLGVGLIFGLLFTGMISAFVSELIYGGQFLLMDMNFFDYWSYVYQMPWVRVGAFSVGMLLGTVLRDLDNGTEKWDKLLPRKGPRSLLTLLAWAISFGIGLTIILITHVHWKHGTGHWEASSLAWFESLSRPMWSVAVAWVVFACNTNRAGPIASILSWPPFVTLSRLSYGVYLLHPLVTMFVVYSRRTAIFLHPNRIDQAYNYCGNIIFTHLFAIVLYVLVEAPLRSFEVFWEPRGRRKPVQ